MKFTILLPHWCTGKMTAYAIAQFLKYKGDHELDIIVINNNPGDGSEKYLEPFMKDIAIVDYPKDKLQSHGIAFDYVMPKVKNEWIISVESDSFPTEHNWLEYFVFLIEDGVDCAGSCLKLSGGEYVHPCGMLFRRSSWRSANNDCQESPYHYFRNIAMKEAFPCHLMVHDSIYEEFLDAPEDFVELAPDYKPYSKEKAIKLEKEYAPTKGPFHHGMGGKEESIRTYGNRTIMSESATLLDERKKFLRRLGYEPGQFFSYWHFLKGKKVVIVPTETKWINDEPGTQQEYTIMRNGFKHLWGISAWSNTDPAENQYAKIKRPIPEQLYATLPAHERIAESSNLRADQNDYVFSDMFVEGFECLKHEVPWITPEAVLKLDEVLKKSDIVLEAGSGGSTLFFARRCHTVATIETSPQWANDVKVKLDAEKIYNVSYTVIPDEEEILSFIKNIRTDPVTVYSVDTQGGWCRSKILNALLKKGISPHLRVIVLDNYGHEGLFPDHYNSKFNLPGWDVFDFNHPRWAGNGTRIYVKR